MASDFRQFAISVLRGVGQAATSDPDVFLLLFAGLLGGPKGVSRALFILVAARRGDQYAGLVASKLDQIARVMHEGNNPA